MADRICISVITVCFNSAGTIQDTVDSISSQDCKNIEHIVVDGGSVDGTVEIVRKSGEKIQKFVTEPDCGVYDAMNKGIVMASGNVIGFLNADDVYSDQTVLSQVSGIFEDATVDACFADLVYVDKYDPARILRYWKSRTYQSGLFERGWMPAHPTFFVRRSVYEKLGGFDLSFPRQADFELTMRFLATHKIKSVYVPHVWVRMRMGGVSNNSVSGVIKGNLEAFRACRKNALDVNVFFIPRKILSRLPQFFRRPV